MAVAAVGIVFGCWGLIALFGSLTNYGGTATAYGESVINLEATVDESILNELLFMALPVVSIFQLAGGIGILVRPGSVRRTVATRILLLILVEVGLFSAFVIHSLYWCWPHHDISFCS